MSVGSPGGYAGEASAVDTYEALTATPEATLIDVRTRAEWTFVGTPSLHGIGKSPVLVEWETFPEGLPNRDFVKRLEAELAARGVGKDAPLYFICRSGARSRNAAVAMTAAGFTQCYNVSPGFEGPLNGERRRGVDGGWKTEGLPWTQT